MTTDIRVSVLNTADAGGTFLTPFWVAFHDSAFDLYDRGQAASAGLEALAEDGNFAPINAEVAAADANAITGAVFGPNIPPIAPGDLGSATFEVDGGDNALATVAAMILPSNDAFVGNGEGIELFDGNGVFQGAQVLNFAGSNVLDAGTEVNTELDAAFINQMGPNEGITENGTVETHPGFLPAGTGEILGGTAATGDVIDEVAGDFTRPGAEIALVHINEYVTTTGDGTGERITGTDVDDLVSGNGGRDTIEGRGGWDEIDGGAGNDVILGGAGVDAIYGGNGNDSASGNAGSDLLMGGAGDDTLRGKSGDDTLDGGTGDDILSGGAGSDVIVFGDGYDRDVATSFDAAEDAVHLNITGIEDYADVMAVGVTSGNRTVFDFGNGDVLVLRDVALTDLSAENFLF